MTGSTADPGTLAEVGALLSGSGWLGWFERLVMFPQPTTRLLLEKWVWLLLLKSSPDKAKEGEARRGEERRRY